MQNQIVEVINYNKKISKKKHSIDCLLAHINWDREFVEDTTWTPHKRRNRGTF